MLENLGITVAKQDHKHNDCVLVIIMTHGFNNGMLFARDTMYNPDKNLRPYFTADKCKSLAGKPKLFFYQVTHFSTIYFQHFLKLCNI